ncbi:OmpA family protein [Nonomuraea sp. NPDC052634]|uniref:OmpA family protein n=1 Tax=Nonomuraea sp. NPDC052634 TaxID=3155813 RepID=UPI0034493773
MRSALVAASLAVVAMIAGCTTPEQATPDAGRKTTAPSAPPTPPTPAVPAQTFSRTGEVGAAAPVDLTVKAVERHRHLTALKLELSVPTADYQTPTFGYGTLNSDFARFWLLDPVGRKVYFTLREQDGETAYGTRKHNPTESFRKGTRYPVEVYFPPLPAGVRQVTVLAGGLGELTGIPVTDGAPEPSAAPGDDGTPEPGSVYRWPVTPPPSDAWSYVADVREYVETPEKSRTQEGTDETVALRTDVLFAFDKATLSDKAAAVLDDVARETRERADPARPPILIEGHTDSKGSDAYNQKLSERRAQAVLDHLRRLLGTEYEYRAAGKGESEPIAPNTRKDGSDNPEGRARNRRVEISYKLKTQAPEVTRTTTASPGTARAAGPAPFRPDLGPEAGTLTRDKLKLHVHPLYRDGAFLVAPFEIENTDTEGIAVPVPQPFRAGTPHEFVTGAAYSGITLVDESSKARYYGTRAGDGFYVQNAVTTIRPGGVQRGYIYFPAPPPEVTAMTFEVDGLGKVQNVPIAR